MQYFFHVAVPEHRSIDYRNALYSTKATFYHIPCSFDTEVLKCIHYLGLQAQLFKSQTIFPVLFEFDSKNINSFYIFIPMSLGFEFKSSFYGQRF